MINFEAASAFYAATDPSFLRKMLAVGVQVHDFRQEVFQRAVSFCLRYNEEHRSAPGASLAGEAAGVTLVDPEAAPEFVLDGMRRIVLARALSKRRDDLSTLIAGGNIDEAYNALREPLDVPSSTRVQRIASLSEQVREQYLSGKRGVVDIETPWPSMTDAMRGFRKGSVTMIVARSAVGKSQALMVIGHFLSIKDVSSLIISPEMAKLDLAERFYMLEAKVSGLDMIRGGLLYDQEQRFYEALGSDIYQSPSVLDFDDNLSHASIRDVVMDLKPGVVLVDSFYRLRPPEPPKSRRLDRKERFEANVSFLLDLGKTTGAAIVCTSQQNRSGIDAEDPGQEVVAISDEAVWDIPYIWSMRQDKDMARDAVVEMASIKIRRGERKTFRARWNFHTCDFSEIVDESQQEFVDEDFGSVPF